MQDQPRQEMREWKVSLQVWLHLLAAPIELQRELQQLVQSCALSGVLTQRPVPAGRGWRQLCCARALMLG